jgi:hypothetical protein
MSFKICSFLFIGLLGLQINCQTRQTLDNTPDNAAQQTVEPNKTDEKIKELFVDSGLGEGDSKFEELMTFPKERIISVVQKIKEDGLSKDDDQYFRESSNEILKMKAASFLWTLNVDREANEKYIVDIESKKDYRHFSASEHLMGFVAGGKKEYLPILFEYSPKWDGAYSYIQWNLYNELENAPKPFLFYLSKEPFKIRKTIYKVLTTKSETYDKERLEKIKAIIKNLKKDKEMKNAAEEFLRETGKMS